MQKATKENSSPQVTRGMVLEEFAAVIRSHNKGTGNG
jgi:hypothetical protein